eukprot:3921602-Pyramimonas_sp.AAC.1
MASTFCVAHVKPRGFKWGAMRAKVLRVLRSRAAILVKLSKFALELCDGVLELGRVADAENVTTRPLADIFNGDLCCYDLERAVGEEGFAEGPARFMTIGPCVGWAAQR